VSSKRDNSEFTAFMALGMVGQLGFAVSIPMVLGGLAGKYLDGWLHAHGIVLILMLLCGIAGGIYGAYLVLAKALRWKQ
jgi:Putative F0F1-ATPase subunit Ca2+/Mg2+ transporter